MEKKQALITLAVTAVLGGSVVVFTKIGLKTIPPLQFLFFRLLFTSLFLLPILKIRNRSLPSLTNHQVWLISLLPAANFLFYIFGVNLTTATITQTIYAFVPVITAVIAHYMIDEKLNRQKGLGIVIGLLGTFLVVALPLLRTGAGGGNLSGNLLILTGAIVWASYPVFSKKLQNLYSPLELTGAMMIPATIISGLAWIITLTYLGWSATSLVNWLIIVYSGGATVVYYLLTHRLIQGVSSVMGTMTLYIQPVATFLWATLLLGEILTPWLVIGGGLTIWGAYLVTKAKG